MKKWFILLAVMVLLVACNEENETALESPKEEHLEKSPFLESDELIKRYIPASKMNAVEVERNLTDEAGREKIGDSKIGDISLQDDAAIRYLFTEQFKDFQYEIYRSDLIYEETGIVIYYYRGLSQKTGKIKSGIYGTYQDENGNWVAGVNNGLGIQHLAFRKYIDNEMLRVGDMKDLMYDYPNTFEKILTFEETKKFYETVNDEVKALAANFRD